MALDINNIIYFKDIIPDYKNSDCVDQTNTERLEELLLSWGFLNVDVSEVSLWKIATQYSSGPRLEWKGDLYVQAPGLHYLKCKNKDKSSYQGCYDSYFSGYILLNTHASGYSNVDWKWIHISELGFGMNKNNAFNWTTDSSLWNYNFITNHGEWKSITNSTFKEEIASSSSIAFTDEAIPSFSYEGYEIKDTLLNPEIGVLARIPKYYLKNYSKENYEAFQGLSFKKYRSSVLDSGGFNINNLVINGSSVSKGVMAYYGFKQGYVPVLLWTNLENDANNNDKEDTIRLQVLSSYVSIGGVSFSKTADDFVCIYARDTGKFKLTKELPMSLNYFGDVAINGDRMNYTGYLNLLTSKYEEYPYYCCLWDSGVLSTAGELNFDKYEDLGSRMKIYKIKNNSSITIELNPYYFYNVNSSSSSYSYWPVITSNTDIFDNLNISSNSLIKSIIKEKTETITLPKIKNIADWADDGSNNNSLHMRLGTYASGEDNSIKRMTQGIETQLTIKNFPYLDIPGYPVELSSAYSSSDSITTAGNCYGYVKAAHHLGMLKEFMMTCTGSVQRVKHGTFPRIMSLIKTPNLSSPDGKWTCYLDSISGTPTLEGISSGWNNFGIRWEHPTWNTREHISWHLSIGYENTWATNTPSSIRTSHGIYIVLWKKVDYDY